MRWVRIGTIILIVVAHLLTPVVAWAATSDTVTITATGWVVEMPGDFTVFYVSDYELGITWTKPATANNTMIRAKYGSYPTDRTDGYLVYYGSGESANDTAVNLEETASTIYYRAWSENLTGAWSSDYAEDLFESIAMTLLALGLLAVGLTTAMFVTRNMMLGYPSALFWAILGGYAYTLSSTPWGDWQYFLFFACSFGMTIFCAMAMYGLREKRDTLADEEMDEEVGEETPGFIDEEEESETQATKRRTALRARAKDRRDRKRLRKEISSRL